MEYEKFIQEIKCPLKVWVFLWLVAKATILTWNNLQKRGWEGPNCCALCKCVEEDEYHLVLACPYSTSVWRKCVALFNVQFDWIAGSSISSRHHEDMLHADWELQLQQRSVGIYGQKEIVESLVKLLSPQTTLFFRLILILPYEQISSRIEKDYASQRTIIATFRLEPNAGDGCRWQQGARGLISGLGHLPQDLSSSPFCVVGDQCDRLFSDLLVVFCMSMQFVLYIDSMYLFY